MADKRPRRAARLADTCDKYLLYQAAVQSPEFELDFIDKTFRQLRRRRALHMREDFCGTALSSCEWVARSPRNTAIAVDLDPAVLAWGAANNVAKLKKKQRERLQLREGDVLCGEDRGLDVVQAFNFSYWILRERRQLLAYFRSVHAALAEDGALFLDAFGGHAAHQCGTEKRKLDGFRYEWEQASYNPVSGDMQCHIHFAFPDRSRIDRAFSYCWRLYGAQEIRDLLDDAGFSEHMVYLQCFDPDTDEPIDEYERTEHCEDHACWLGYIVALP